MRIARIVQTRHRIPFDPPIQTAWDAHPRDSFDVDLVWVETDDGMLGIGAGAPIPYLPDHMDLFIGADPLDLQRHNRVIESLSLHHGPAWALDLALWDLAGNIHEQPVWRMLGGTDQRLRTYAALGVERPTDELASLAQDVITDGFQALLVRLNGQDWKADADCMAAVREAVGADLVLLADCGRGAPLPWRTEDTRSPEDTVALVKALEELGVFWIEDPLHRADYKGLADLREQTNTNIAGGAYALELHDIRNLIVRDAIDVLRADAAHTGGITGLFPLGQRAKERGLMVSPRAWSNGITMMANAHLAAALGACPCFEYAIDPPSFGPDTRDFLLAEPLLPDEQGWLDLGDAPGFGLSYSQDALNDTQIPMA